MSRWIRFPDWAFLQSVLNYTGLFFESLLSDRKYLAVLFISYTLLALIVAFISTVPGLSLLKVRTHFGIFSSLRTLITSTMIPLAHVIFSSDRNCFQVLQYPPRLLIRLFYGRFFALMPIFAVIEICMTAIIYPIMKLRSGFGHVFAFWLTLLLNTMSARALGMLSVRTPALTCRLLYAKARPIPVW